MPFDPRKEFVAVPPEKAANYRGLSVFRAYGSRDIRQPDFWFYELRPENDPEKAPAWLFDIRDLENPKGYPLIKAEAHMYLLRDAIDAKVLPPRDWCQTVGWSFRLKDKR